MQLALDTPAVVRNDRPMSATKSTKIIEKATKVFAEMEGLPLDEQVSVLNALREALHTAGPFANEPVDLVRWVKSEKVTANDYNPNSVAPPEMKLLEISIMADGYTQPIVTDADAEAGRLVVVDGFHRNRVGRESAEVKARIHGYLPVVQIRAQQTDRSDRIAATIRHNRARGKHQVEQMSNIVLELKRRNWSDEKIGRELGMDPDEVLRLAQISGLADAFKDHEFSKAWETDFTADDEAVESIIADGPEECIDG